MLNLSTSSLTDADISLYRTILLYTPAKSNEFIVTRALMTVTVLLPFNSRDLTECDSLVKLVR